MFSVNHTCGQFLSPTLKLCKYNFTLT